MRITQRSSNKQEESLHNKKNVALLKIGNTVTLDLLIPPQTTLVKIDVEKCSPGNLNFVSVTKSEGLFTKVSCESGDFTFSTIPGERTLYILITTPSARERTISVKFILKLVPKDEEDKIGNFKLYRYTAQAFSGNLKISQFPNFHQFDAENVCYPVFFACNRGKGSQELNKKLAHFNLPQMSLETNRRRNPQSPQASAAEKPKTCTKRGRETSSTVASKAKKPRIAEEQRSSSPQLVEMVPMLADSHLSMISAPSSPSMMELLVGLPLSYSMLAQQILSTPGFGSTPPPNSFAQAVEAQYVSTCSVSPPPQCDDTQLQDFLADSDISEIFDDKPAACAASPSTATTTQTQAMNFEDLKWEDFDLPFDN